MKYGSKERDNETGLDYFLARYHTSTQGRFTSVDPENVGAIPELPQSWNGYSYALNNPLRYSDPDGLRVRICDNNGNCTEISDEDANKYFYNKKYQQQSGYSTDGKGNIFDTQGNQIGTYRNISIDGSGMPGADRLVFHDLPNEFSNPLLMIGSAIGGGRSLARPRKPVNLPSNRKVSVDLDHIVDNHTATGRGYSASINNPNTKMFKDKFPDTMTPDQIEGAVRDAYAHSEIVRTQGSRVVLNGVTRDGTVIEIYFNRATSKIETAYPKGRVSE